MFEGKKIDAIPATAHPVGATVWFQDLKTEQFYALNISHIGAFMLDQSRLTQTRTRIEFNMSGYECDAFELTQVPDDVKNLTLKKLESGKEG